MTLSLNVTGPMFYHLKQPLYILQKYFNDIMSKSCEQNDSSNSNTHTKLIIPITL